MICCKVELMRVRKNTLFLRIATFDCPVQRLRSGVWHRTIVLEWIVSRYPKRHCNMNLVNVAKEGPVQRHLSRTSMESEASFSSLAASTEYTATAYASSASLVSSMESTAPTRGIVDVARLASFLLLAIPFSILLASRLFVS